jgi:asparagine synthase (glutamine-hydrolysing)
VNTFSVGFREEEFNELPYAKELAEKYGTNHMELLIEPDIEEDIHSILSDLGEPFGDSSLIPSYLVTKEMSKFYKVALSGDGGDELFGYPSYADFFELETFFNRVPKRYRNLKINGSKLFSRLGVGENLGRFKKYVTNQPNGNCLKRGMVFRKNELNMLFQNRKPDYTGDYLNQCWSSLNEATLTDRVIAGSLKSRLLNDYLTKVDRSSMMNSLEVRSPFLDKHLGSLAFSIPNSVKFNENQPKALLKELAKKYIDPKIHERKKAGFGIPINHWLRKELKPLLSEYLSTGSLKKHGLFNESFVDTVVKEHLSGSIDHRHKLWCLLSFQIWFENHG